MSVRTLTIGPFQLPDGTNQSTEVVIALVDADNQRIQGLETASGTPIIDQVTSTVGATGVEVDLYPTNEIEGNLAYGSSATTGTNYYLVTLRNRTTRFEHKFRTQLTTGASTVTWAEFVSGAGDLTGGTLSDWQTHIINTLKHLPTGAATGQIARRSATGWDPDDLGSSLFLISTFSGATPPIANQLLALACVPTGVTVSFPADLSGSYGYTKTLATAQTDFDVQVDGVSKGTIRWTATGNEAAFIAATGFGATGPARVEVLAPATPDATLANFGFTIKASRTDS